MAIMKKLSGALLATLALSSAFPIAWAQASDPYATTPNGTSTYGAAPYGSSNPSTNPYGSPVTQPEPAPYKPILSLPPLQGYYDGQGRPGSAQPATTVRSKQLPLPEKPPAELVQPLSNNASQAFGNIPTPPESQPVTKLSPAPGSTPNFQPLSTMNQPVSQTPSSTLDSQMKSSQAGGSNSVQTAQPQRSRTRTVRQRPQPKPVRQETPIQAIQPQNQPYSQSQTQSVNQPVNQPYGQPPMGQANTQTFDSSTGNSTDSALTINTASQKVPAGTFLKIAFNSALDSRITSAGEPFSVILTDDFTTLDPANHVRVILPAGTFIRGWVEQVRRPSLFSRGGAIFLGFDHIVMPDGELLPVDLHLSTVNTLVNRERALYSDPGIPTKLKKSVDSGMGIVGKFTQAGVEAGKQTADGLGSIITVPVAAAGGVVAGTAVAAGKSAAALVGKGESVVIRPGDSMTVDFGGSFNLPLE